MIRSTSRNSYQTVKQNFDAKAAGLSNEELVQLFEELTQVTRFFHGSHGLRQIVSNPGENPEAKISLMDKLFGDKVAAPALEVIRSVAREEWSDSSDVVLSFAQLGNLSLLIEAERQGKLEEVEDELFRFGRILESNPELNSALSNQVTPVEGRAGLLAKVLNGKTTTATALLLRRGLVFHGHNHSSLDSIVTWLTELAAGRRGESIARVVAAHPLSEEQETKLQTILSKIYNRPVSVQVEIDPEVLGGLKITVGDEIIDGTTATKLATAASGLPH